MAGVGGRVAVVGGSIAGCAAALALSRAGCDVTVYERSRGDLNDRGAAIGIPVPLRDSLVSAGYLDATMPACRASERVWITADGGDRYGRVIWRQPSLVAVNNWGVLWRTLRTAVPDAAYRQGAVVAGVTSEEHGATLTFQDGSAERFDVIVGADGYRSVIRPLVHPGGRPAYAGYLGWRGGCEEGRLADLGPLVSGTFVTVCYPGGHGLFLLTPGFDCRADPGCRRVNWVIYTPTPAGVSFDDLASIPPGSVPHELSIFFDRFLDGRFPAHWAEVVRRADRGTVSVQPICDQSMPTYVSGRMLLIGDASTITRPHTASGATKALQDALALERACRQHGSWEEVLAVYDEERCGAGNDLVELGRRLGRAQVEQAPDWASMTSEDFDAWTRATLAGRALYFYGNVSEGGQAKVSV